MSLDEVGAKCPQHAVSMEAIVDFSSENLAVPMICACMLCRQIGLLALVQD